MSRRIRRVESDSSLELLLDTICNTFGGILFLALLVTILMSQRTEKLITNPVENALQAEMERLTTELTSLQEELSQARKSAETLKQIGVMISDPEIKRLLNRKEDLEQSLNRLEKSVTVEIADVSREQTEVNKATNEIAVAENMLSAAKMELDKLKERLEKAIDENSRTAGFPIAQRTRKQQVTVCIKGGRACFLEKRVNGLLIDDATQMDESNSFLLGAKIVPLFENGISVKKSDRLEFMKKKLDEYDEQESFFRLFIWNDSFESYQILTDLISGRKFGYEVNPMLEGEFLTRGPANARVQ